METKHLIITGCLGDSTIYSSKLTADGTYFQGSPKEPTIKLFASKKDSNWTKKVRGKVLASLKCTGDNVNIKFLGGLEMTLDYGQLFELELLLNEYRAANPEQRTKTIRAKLS